jgi:hypothetical protein
MAIITDPDWIDPDEATFDVEKPIRSEQGVMLASNPIAIAQGKPGAPKVKGRALDIGIGNLSGNTAIVGLDAVASLLLVVTNYVSASTYNDMSVGYQLTKNGGASWSSSVTLAKAGGTSQIISATGSKIIDMTGYNGIRAWTSASTTSNLIGSAIWVKGE